MVAATGVMLLITGLLSGVVLRFVPEAPLVLSFAPLGLLVTGGFVFFRGRQYAAQASAENVFHPGAPTVLYLRPFTSDVSTAGQTFSAILTPSLYQGWSTEEEQLADVFRPFGSFVAIGQPGERLPLPGAARQYADHGEWQEVVTDMMRAAQLVVIKAGDSPGILWELGRAWQTVAPHRLLVLVLRISSARYERFRADAGRTLGVPLPQHRPRSLLGIRAGFIRFSPASVAEYVPVRAPMLRRALYKPMRRMFAHALRPVYEDHAIPWSPPPVSKPAIAFFVFNGLFWGLLFGPIMTAVLAAWLGGMLWGAWRSRTPRSGRPSSSEQSVETPGHSEGRSGSEAPT